MKSTMIGTLRGPHDATNEGLRSLYPQPHPHPATWSRQERPRILIRTLSPDLLTEITTAHSSFGERINATAQELSTRRLWWQGASQLSFLTLLLLGYRTDSVLGSSWGLLLS